METRGSKSYSFLKNAKSSYLLVKPDRPDRGRNFGMGAQLVREIFLRLFLQNVEQKSYKLILNRNYL